jgi:hypothetical protein
MTPEDAAAATADAIVGLPTGFMMDGATFEHGAEMGYEGIDFYTAGRGGALGDVCAGVVAASFVMFNPSAVAESWDRGRKVASPLDAAAAFGACLRSWALAHLGADVDYARLAELAGRVVDGASVAGVPLFAAWSVLPEPEEPRALALHRVNLLRELRGGLHGAAVIASGLTPLEAVMVKTPYFAGLFGWPEPWPDAEPHRAAWERAEASTNRAMARAFTVLEPAERAELVELADTAKAGAS